MKEAYKQGREDYLSGVKIDDCPYQDNDMLYRSWMAGWEDARYEDIEYHGDADYERF